MGSDLPACFAVPYIGLEGRYVGIRFDTNSVERAVVYGHCFHGKSNGNAGYYVDTKGGRFGPLAPGDEIVEILPQYRIDGTWDRISALIDDGYHVFQDFENPEKPTHVVSLLPEETRMFEEAYGVELSEHKPALYSEIDK